MPGDTNSTTYYVPLNRARHPAVLGDPKAVHIYDAAALPLRTHEKFKIQAAKVDRATTNAMIEKLSKKYGIKGLPLLYHLDSLRFPKSFPYDFMHLIWENLLKNLILLWTGDFKNLDEGNGDYTLAAAVWKAIGELTSQAKKDIPSAYGAALPNIAADGVTVTA